jgi:hypothetical protein
MYNLVMAFTEKSGTRKAIPRCASATTSICLKMTTGLRLRLKQGAKMRAQRDLALAEDWFGLEEEASLRARA